MYHVSAQGVDERMINVHYYYYYYCRAAPSWRTQAFRWSAPPRGGLLATPGRITLPTRLIMPPLLVTRPPTTCLVGVKTARTQPRRRSVSTCVTDRMQTSSSGSRPSAKKQQQQQQTKKPTTTTTPKTKKLNPPKNNN